MGPAPLRVLVFMTTHVGRSGRHIAVRSVLAGLGQRGHATALVVPAEARPAEALGLPGGVHPGRGRFTETLRPARLPAWVAEVRRHVRGFRPDAVLVTELRGLPLAWAACLGLRPRPVVLSWLHSDPRARRHPWALRCCDGHLAIGAGLAELLRRNSGRPAWVVYNPIAVAERPVPRPERDEAPALLYVGRCSGEKRIDRVLSALAPLRHLPWTLQVVGDGPDRSALTREADRLGFGERVTWSGWVTDPWGAVPRASALLLTSETEGFPLVLLEAAARGVPAIALDCDFGPREFIRPGVNGWLLPAGDGAGLSTLLARLCAGDVALPASEVVRSTAEPFALSAVLDRFEARLAAACDPRPTGRLRSRQAATVVSPAAEPNLPTARV